MLPQQLLFSDSPWESRSDLSQPCPTIGPYRYTLLISFTALFTTLCWFLLWASPPERVFLHLPTPPKTEAPFSALLCSAHPPVLRLSGFLFLSIRPSGFRLLSASGRHQQELRGKEEKEDWVLLRPLFLCFGDTSLASGRVPPQWHL